MIQPAGSIDYCDTMRTQETSHGTLLFVQKLGRSLNRAALSESRAALVQSMRFPSKGGGNECDWGQVFTSSVGESLPVHASAAENYLRVGQLVNAFTATRIFNVSCNIARSFVTKPNDVRTNEPFTEAVPPCKLHATFTRRCSCNIYNEQVVYRARGRFRELVLAFDPCQGTFPR